MLAARGSAAVLWYHFSRMSDPPTESPPASPSSTDVDLYCLQCGYNLRGLSGDPRRCPECGHLNPMGELTIPAALIREQLKRMETAPAFCLMSFIAMCGSGAFWSYFAYVEPDADVRNLFFYPLVFAPIIWLIAAVRFRESCLARLGWRRALLKYHLYGVVYCGAILGSFYGAGFIPSQLWESPLLLGGFVIGICILIVLGGRLAQGYARADMLVLQRDVAVDMVREALKARLRRQH